MEIFGYKNIKTILSSPNYSLFSAIRIKENKSYLLKKYLTNSEFLLADIKRELGFHLLLNPSSSLELDQLLEFRNQYYATFSYFSGSALSVYLASDKLPLINKLKIAKVLTALLEQLDNSKIIHNNFAPYNLLISDELNEARLVDFSFAHSIDETNHNHLHQNSSFINYISPELTGRIEKNPSHSSDLYSLGIILYELFTGKNPFACEDPYQTIHHHLAKEPIPPIHINSEIPEFLSQIILKLIQKDSSERYQSAKGLLYDLQSLFDEFREGNNDHPRIGTNDVSLKFSEEIYGRQYELDIIQEQYLKVMRGSKEICFLIGHSGTGKSTLIHYFQKNYLQDVIFLDCKLGKVQENLPFLCFTQIFQKLVNNVLKQPEEVINDYKNKLNQNIGNIGKILTDLVPEMELLIGKYPSIGELPIIESRKRFSYAIRRFFKIVTESFGPLVIFFDDLHWIDKSSLDLLLEILTDKEIQNLFFVGAYRDEESYQTMDFLHNVLEERQEKFAILYLSNLTFQDFNNYISDLLKINSNLILDLSSIIFSKTSGNPFFTCQFLRDLVKQKLLWFEKKWQWDLKKIKELEITDSAVKFIASKVKILPENTRRLIQLASCLGTKFDAKLLQIIEAVSIDKIYNDLYIAVEENLLLNTDNYYRFSHDGIQQACNSLVDDPISFHLEIARRLYGRMEEQQKEVYLLTIVYHYNIGIPLLTAKEERHLLCLLNLHAAKKVKANVAFQSFFDLTTKSRILLHEEAWRVNYNLALEVYTLNAEAAYLIGAFDEMENCIKVVLENAFKIEDKIKVFELKILAYVAQSMLPEAIEVGLSVLKMLDISISRNPSNIEILFELVKIDFYLKRKGGAGEIINLPTMNNDNAYAAIRIICSVGAAAYFSAPKLYPLLSCKAFSLILRYGHCDYSAFICASFGALLIGGLGQINKGYAIGMTAFPLLKRFNSTFIKCKTLNLIYLFVTHWKQPLRDSEEPLLDAYVTGIESGDTEYAGYCVFSHGFVCFFSGMHLEQLKTIMLKNYQILENFRHDLPIFQHQVFLQTVWNLNELTEDPTLLSGKFFDEENIPEAVKKGKMETVLFNLHLCKLILCFLFGRFNESRNHALQARKRLESVICSPQPLVFYFFDSLSIVSYLESHKSKDELNLRKQLNNNLTWLKKAAKSGPENALHKYFLVLAEFHKLSKNYKKAIYYYQKSIRLAISNKYMQDVAIGYELLAKFYLKEKDILHYENFIVKAYEAYIKWGAKIKAQTLFKSKEINNFYLPDHISLNSQHLDTRSLMNAATVLSEEIVLQKLLKKLIEIVMQYGGAQKICFLLNTGSQMKLVARSDINYCDINPKGLEKEESLEVPTAIISYVTRKKDFIVLNDVTQESQFSRDPYIFKNNPKSILAGPVLFQGEVIAALYLENALSKNVFSSENVEVLKILSGQIAISIRNSRYYEQLEQDVQKRTKEFLTANEVLKQQKEKIHFQNLKLKEASEKAEKSAKVKEDFLSLMSHEILTPLDAIIGFTKLLMDDKYPDPIYANLKKIKFSADTLQALIKDILHYLKIESNKIVTLEEDFDLYELLGGIQDMLMPKMLEKGLKFNMDIDRSIPSLLFGDKNKLSQILINLLGNAVKFTPAGTVEIKVRISETRGEKINLVFSIIDSGIGIEENKLKVIFEEFTQASDTITKKYGGTGLGLAIVKKLVKLMEGKIEVKSKIGIGSVFTFNAKFIKSQLPKHETLFLNDSHLLSDKTILVIDDQNLNLELTKQILVKKGAKVFATESCPEAIDWLSNNICDIIITDIKMAEMTGDAFSRYLREKFSYPKNEIPVLGVTAHIFKDKKEIMRESGINEILYKPLNSKELVSAILKLTNSAPGEEVNVRSDRHQLFPYLASVFKDEESFKNILERHSEKLEIYRDQLNIQLKNIDTGTIVLTLHSLYNVLNALDIKSYNVPLKEMEKTFEKFTELISHLEEEHQKLKDRLEEITKDYED